MTKILCVDDNKENVYFLDVLLKKRGFKVITATNGSEALESALMTPPDLIISDILMPVMDGFTLCRKWKTNERLKHIPFIFYTATYTGAKDEEFALSLGADRFVIKPQAPDDLMRIVLDMLSEHHIGAAINSKYDSREEAEILEKYSEILSHKLEQKVAELEQANLDLAQNIFKQKRVEEALRTAQLQLSDAMELASVVYWEIDLEDDALILNDSFYALYGTTADQEGGYRMTRAEYKKRFVHPDDQRLVFQEREQNPPEPECGALPGFEHRIIRRDGEVRHIIVRAKFVWDDSGHIVRNYGTNQDITSRKHNEQELTKTMEKLRKSLMGTIQAMSLTVETRDPYTAGHQKRVANLARTIAQTMGLSKESIDNIRMAGAIHDIGKMSVPAEILSRPARLKDIEFSLIKLHPQTGYDILKDTELPYPVAEIILQHHERLDGSGYPQGLKDEQILLETRIISVADVVEAMASHRPYRPSLGVDAALNEIMKNRGILYDGAAVDACVRLFREKGFTL
jgi:putative nucleotidyltransferase with HDIG domain/PAS domain S-box-containing protein